MTVRLSQAAQLDLFQIALDGLDQFGPHQVAKYEAGLQVVLGTLEANPRLAAERADHDPPVRIHPYQAHVIIYRIDDTGIFVLRVCHAREDWTRLV